jgi:hypothetical protein
MNHAEKGIARPDIIPILEIQNLPDGVAVAIVPCSDHGAFTALPGGIEIGGRIHGKTGWNSDRGIAYYRSDAVIGAAWEGNSRRGKTAGSHHGTARRANEEQDKG